MESQIVIIDDDPIYRLIVSKMINHIDSSLEIHECKNAIVGLDKLKTFENSKHTVIVLLDLNMPLMNGWDFLKEVEKLSPAVLRNIEIYMVSSSTDDSDISKSKAYKFIKGFISKPLSKENITTILGE